MATDLPPQLREAFAGAPDDERALLEVRLQWSGLDDAQARIAARLRVFLLTWDPLGWHEPSRGRATATGNGDDCEVVLYLPLEQILAATDAGEDLAVVVGTFAASVLSVGAWYEQALVAGVYPQLAFEGKAPDLLSELDRLSGIAPPALELASRWDPIGLGAIQDLVQQEFGPVDLDRSAVRLEAVAQPLAGCPACAGQRLGFPADLADATPAMCAPHAERSQAIIENRLQRARDSNSDGMDAISGCSQRLTEPTFGLTLALLRRLEEIARRDPAERLSSAELAADAELAVALAARLGGEPEPVAELVAHRRLSLEWMVDLPAALASRGLVDEAVAVGDAFAALDPADANLFAGEAAQILAQAGRGAEALRRVADNADSFPGSAWTHIRAAAVHAQLGDPARAEAALRTALVLARSHGHAGDVATVWLRLGDLLGEQPGRADEADEAMQESERWSEAADGGSRIVAKIGRNDPCPCGSGRKHKRCCGA